MKTSIRKTAMTVAALAAALTLTAAGAGLAVEKAADGKPGYERCDTKDHAGHWSGKLSKAWKKTLTGEQRAQVDKLHADLEKEVAPLKAKIHAKRMDVRALLTTDNPDRAALAKAVDEISVLEKQAMQARYDHMIKVRSLLTPEQKSAFDRMMMKGEGDGHGRGK